MGFFDDLGKRVTDAGQRAVQKTQELSEVSRINSLISQNESKINNTYYQIGKLYVSIHGNDGEEEFAGMLATVAELELQNAEFKKQIQDVKGVQRCPKCGAEVSRGVAFCSSCGTAMPKMESKELITDGVKCPKCGAMVKKGMRFCTSCGQTMSSPAPQSLADGAEIAESAEKVCPKCGATITDDSAFCTECGTKL